MIFILNEIILFKMSLILSLIKGYFGIGLISLIFHGMFTVQDPHTSPNFFYYNLIMYGFLWPVRILSWDHT